MDKILNNIDLISDSLYGAAGLLWGIFSIGRLIIKKWVFDYFQFFSQNSSNQDFIKRPFNSIIEPFSVIYFFKALPNKRLNPDFYNDDKSKSLLSELKAFSKIFGYLLLSSIILLITILIIKKNV